MTPWKLPLLVAAIVVPIAAAFLLGGSGVGAAVGALAALAIVVTAVRQRPMGPIGSPPEATAPRRVLVVIAGPVEDPAAVEAIAREVGAEGAAAEVLVLAPASIGFLDRWATDVAGARQRAQERLVATVAALAKAGVAAEARVGDEDIVQAVEDQLQSYTADEVLMVGSGDDSEHSARAAAELKSRLRAEFHLLTLDGE